MLGVADPDALEPMSGGWQGVGGRLPCYALIATLMVTFWQTCWYPSVLGTFLVTSEQPFSYPYRKP